MTVYIELNSSVRQLFDSGQKVVNWNWKVLFAPMNFQHELPNKNLKFEIFNEFSDCSANLNLNLTVPEFGELWPSAGHRGWTARKWFFPQLRSFLWAVTTLVIFHLAVLARFASSGIIRMHFHWILTKFWFRIAYCYFDQIWIPNRIFLFKGFI